MGLPVLKFIVVLSLVAMACTAAKTDDQSPNEAKGHAETEGQEEGTSSKVGPGLAVTAFNAEDGFKLSEKALQTLKINFLPLKGEGPWQVNANALVSLKHVTGVYRRFEGWISFVMVKVIERKDSQVRIASEDLEANDEIAVNGAMFIRMEEADLHSESSDSCGH